LVLPQREQSMVVRDAIFNWPRELWIFVVFGERRDPEGIALLHRLGMLRCSEDIAPRRPGNFDTGIAPGCCGIADRICIEADVIANPARSRSTVTELNRNGFIGVPWHSPDRPVDFPATNCDSDYVSGSQTVSLSQVILFCGFGISWSHALFDRAPSPTEGSGRNTTSSPAAFAIVVPGTLAAGALVSGRAVP
jgi:hypothetical protein